MPPSPQLRPRSQLLLGIVASCLLAIVGAGLYLRDSAAAGLTRIDAEVQDIVETEAWTQQTGKSLLTSSLVDSQADRQWQERFRWNLNYSGPFSAVEMAQGNAEIQNIALRSDLAMVAVTVQGSDGTRRRQTRFYRQDQNDGWLRTSPSSAFWGSTQTVETAHFRLHYRHRDEPAVLATAARLDTIYADLRRDAGLPPAKDKLTIEVKPLSTRQLDYLQLENNRLEVHSPLLLQVPETLSDEEILTKSIVNRLVAYVLRESEQRVAIRWQWRPMLSGLRLWQAYVGSDSLVLWYQDTVSWLHEDAPDIRSGRRAANLQDLSRLCRADVIWKYDLPGDLAHPLCTDANWALRLPSIALRPVRLDAFYELGESDQELTRPWAEEWVRRVAAATVIDYIVETYGRQRLPALMVGFRTYDSWDALAPAVLGVPAEELEAGWQTHLQDQISARSAANASRARTP